MVPMSVRVGTEDAVTPARRAALLVEVGQEHEVGRVQVLNGTAALGPGAQPQSGHSGSGRRFHLHAGHAPQVNGAFTARIGLVGLIEHLGETPEESVKFVL